MKKVFAFVFAVILGLALCSCDRVSPNEEEAVPTQASLEAQLTDIYSAIPMNAFNVSDQYTTLATYSKGCDYSMNVYGFWDYNQISSINRFLQLLDTALEKEIIDQDTRDSMRGEALFARAYCYFAMVRRYGGVPLVTEPLGKNEGDKNLGNTVPRNTEKLTWDFVISELDNAARLLPEERTDGSYRATKWAALGLQSRVALYAASVSKYWGKEAIPSSYKAVEEKLTYMEASFADAYYEKCIEACTTIMNTGKFSLYGGASTSVSKSKENLTNLFLARQDCEFIFGKAGTDGASNPFDLLYSPNQKHAEGANMGWGNYSVTSDFADLFDNYSSSGGRANSVIKTRNDGKEDFYFSQIGTGASTFDINTDFIKYYSPQDPFLNKDARFHAWVLYPGAYFRDVTITAQGGIWLPGDNPVFYSNYPLTYGGDEYYGLGAKEDQISAFLNISQPAPDNHASYWNCCFGIRKFLDPQDTPLSTASPWCDIRYAEILLNYAEAFAESGKGSASIARQALNDIRHRAAFTDNIEPTLENVLHERQVEFAFEGHESFTLHRRRAYLNTRSGKQYRKHTLLPVLDLRDGTPRYIFPRVNVYHGDVALSPDGLDTDLLDYYAAIPNLGENALTGNPIQE